MLVRRSRPYPLKTSTKPDFTLIVNLLLLCLNIENPKFQIFEIILFVKILPLKMFVIRFSYLRISKYFGALKFDLNLLLIY